MKYYFSTFEVINTIQIFANTFHSAAVHSRGYLIKFWMIFTLEKRIDLPGKLLTFMFFISRVSGGALSIDAKRHIWFTRRAGIFASLLLLLYYWGLCCEILQLNFSLKYYSHGTLNVCTFKPVRFGVVMGKSHWKNLISNTKQNVRSWKSCGHSSMKSFPLHLWQERFFLCIGEDTKFCFEWLITCAQTRKKWIKWLVRGRNASILGQILWK